MTKKRNIKSIAPFLADNFTEVDEPLFDLDQYAIFLSQNFERLKSFRKYLIGKLHDSWVLDYTIEADKLEIRLNDFSPHVFADAVIEKFGLDIEHEKLVFPIILEFSGNLRVEFNRVEENGNMVLINPISVDEYLGEQILKLNDDEMEIAFELWRSNPTGERILMIVSAKEFDVKEHQEKSWNEIFGNKYEGYYQYFRKQFESDRYVSDYTECLNLVGEYEIIKAEKNKS